MEQALAPSTVVFQDKLWVIGGYHSGWKNDAWSSVDGSNWIQESSSGLAFRGRNQLQLPFDGKLWVLGGWNGGGLINTIRNSSDGKTWQTITPVGPLGT